MTADAATHDRNGKRSAISSSILQPAVLSVLSAPQGLDVPVSDAVIFDGSDQNASPHGAVVLAVGV